MELKIFRRHSADCPDKADRYAPRCGCPLWGEFNWPQSQTTLSAPKMANSPMLATVTFGMASFLRWFYEARLCIH